MGLLYKLLSNSSRKRSGFILPIWTREGILSAYPRSSGLRCSAVESGEIHRHRAGELEEIGGRAFTDHHVGGEAYDIIASRGYLLQHSPVMRSSKAISEVFARVHQLAATDAVHNQTLLSTLWNFWPIWYAR